MEYSKVEISFWRDIDLPLSQNTNPNSLYIISYECSKLG
jgi:hypothetical protein